MIILDKKSYELLAYLIDLESPETVMAISKKLKQSRRKIYYHLDKINEALPLDMEKIISYPRVGICLTEEQKTICRDLMAELDDYSYVLTIQERLQLMLVMIAVSDERVTLEKLMGMTGVSRNTALNDITAIRQDLLEKYPAIRLEVTKARGYYLSGSPLNLLRYLYQLLATIYMKGTENFVSMLGEKVTGFGLWGEMNSDRIEYYFEEELNKARGKLGKSFNRRDSQLMLKILPYLVRSYRSNFWTDVEKTELQEELKLTQSRIEFRLVQEMADDLRQNFDLDLDEIEVSLIALMLLSYRKDRDSHLDSQVYEQMRQNLADFVDRFEQNSHRTFSNKSDLVRQLLIHCKSLVYRKAYGMTVQNPLTEHIIEKYPDLFYLTKICSQELEEAWNISLTDDDLAYLTIHFGGSLRQTAVVKSHKITIVCDEGVAVQKLLLSQCRRYIKSSTKEAVYTSVQFESVRDILTSDLVLTTMDLPDCPVPSLRISPILTDEDLVRMLRFISNNGQRDQLDLSTGLEQSLKTYLKDDKTVYVLRNKIEKLLQKEILSILLLGQEE